MSCLFHFNGTPTGESTCIMAHSNPRQERSGSSNSSNAVIADEDDWRKLSDAKERRRIQNRLAQRQYRKSRKTREQQRSRAQSDASCSSTPAPNISATPANSIPTHESTKTSRGHASDRYDLGHLSKASRRTSQATACREFSYEDLGLTDTYTGDPEHLNFITSQPPTPGFIQEKACMCEGLLTPHSPFEFSNDELFGDLSLELTPIGTPDDSVQWMGSQMIPTRSEVSVRELGPPTPGSTFSSIQSPATRSTSLSEIDYLNQNSRNNSNTPSDVTPPGRTMLHLAAEKGSVSIIELLLESGLDINTVDSYRQTALHVVALKGRSDAMRALLEKGIDVDRRDNDGRTALLIAAQKGHERLVKLLLDWKSDVNAADMKGCTPLQAAILEGHEDVVRLLLKYGSDVKKVVNA